MKDLTKIKKFIKILYLSEVCFIGLAACHLAGNKNGELKFNPVLNKVYHFLLTKYSIKSWSYHSKQFKIYDSVYIGFSLQKINGTDTSATCRLTLNKFIWKGRFKVNYIRDSAHSISTNVVLSDRGKVENVQDMNEILRDIEKDSAAERNLSGVIPNQISESAIADMLNRIFSVIPAKTAKVNDTWISNITLITGHPVSISNFNVLKSHNLDTAAIEIQSNVFARPSPGDEPYIQGNQKGIAFIIFSTGIPYLYKIQSEIVTTTNYYDIKETENFTLNSE
jgi:hypothetical protein